ncbi:hypothetical protein [Robiginitalea aurantiaca]|uniref:DUF805 domain-containing protein n=1 Tax=Robiginitalea aurantiaca TaxID=3056915 RepID=A0ABT7WDN9_9FLAO|nr:hypothetical protein [Robiginitalea aurantiaca]MDM9631037.1 hypothetical protein [Robiginitalea aurantiaca]
MKTLQIATLDTLDNAQLLSLIKKHKWAGLSKEAMDKIVQILSGRGLDKDVLRRIGYLSADPFNEALKYYLAFKRYSKWVFVCYLVFIGSILTSYLFEPSPVISVGLILIFSSLLTLVMVALFKQSLFYRALGAYHSDGSPLAFFFLGMPLFFLMYFSYKQKMETRLEELV